MRIGVFGSKAVSRGGSVGVSSFGSHSCVLSPLRVLLHVGVFGLIFSPIFGPIFGPIFRGLMSRFDLLKIGHFGFEGLLASSFWRPPFRRLLLASSFWTVDLFWPSHSFH